MANTFSFLLNEQNVRVALAEIVQQRLNNPGRQYNLLVSIELTPDGIGYDAHDLRVDIVRDEPKES